MADPESTFSRGLLDTNVIGENKQFLIGRF